MSIPLVEIRNARLQKVAELRALGIPAYPSRSSRTHYAKAVLDGFEGLEGTPVSVAGRLMSWRRQGAVAFGHIQDQSGRIQLFFRRDGVAPTRPRDGVLGYEHLHLIDVGDIVEGAGVVMRTQRGEISVQVEEFRILTKSLRPLPDQWYGLKHRESILRKRYLDTVLNSESHDRFLKVARISSAARSFLDARSFVEFQTPIIQPQYGGGAARPFTTRVNALDCEMFLAISHELYLKRLIAAGYDRVYTIGRYFRNEGLDQSHHPEFGMIETMTAYENYEFNMALIEDLFRHVAFEVFGRGVFKVAGHAVDFAEPWRRVSMADAVRDVTGVDFDAIDNVLAANRALADLGIQEPQESVGEALALAFEERAAKTLIAPTLVYGHPVEISPLAKPRADDPRYAERFEIFVAGMECGDNWSEQNDPVQLRERWRIALEQARGNDEEVHPLDYDFLEVLEYGLPPTTGIGPGIERMAMIFTEQEKIDDVIFFPMLRPVISQANRVIYDVRDDPSLPPPGHEIDLDLPALRGVLASGCILPPRDPVRVRPHVSFWPTQEAGARRGHVTGACELLDLVPGRLITVHGFQQAVESAEPTAIWSALRAWVDREVCCSLRDAFPTARVEVSGEHRAGACLVPDVEDDDPR